MTDQEITDIIDELVETVHAIDKYIDEEGKELNRVLDEEYKELYNTTIEGDLETRKGVNAIDSQYVETIDKSNKLQEEILTSVMLVILIAGYDDDMKTREFNKSLNHILEVNSISVNEMMDKYKKTRKSRLRNIPRLSFQNDLSTSKTIKELRKSKSLDKNSIDAINKTAAMSAYNERRMDTMKQDDIQQVIVTAVLDNRTTKFCRDLDGKIYDIDEAPMPPYHYRCRTSLLPVIKDKSGAKYKEVVKSYNKKP